MTTIANISRHPPRSTLEDLFTEAESFGVVEIYSNKDRRRSQRYMATIIFPTVQGTDIKATSEFGMTLLNALRQAIERARMIRGQFR